MTSDRERVIELVNELGSRVGHVLQDMIPPAAQVHLLNAQRELITALMLIYENRVAPAPGFRQQPRNTPYHRTSAVPQERPAPKPLSTASLPGWTRPSAAASSRASGTEPADVLP